MSSAPAATTNADEVQPCHLLELPGELKNEIYRLVIVTSDKEHPIEIKSGGFERSALFLTCKEIHHDAMKIFLLENSFRHKITRFRSASLAKFQRLCSKYLEWKAYLNMNFGVLIYFFLDGEDDDHTLWENLIAYLHNSYTNSVLHVPVGPAEVERGPSDSDLDMMLQHTIGSMFAIAEATTEDQWRTILGIFKQMRPSLSAVDEEWSKDSPT